MGPSYEVTAVWTERYCSTVQIEADNPDEARRRARQIWREDTLDFLTNAEFETSRLLRYDVTSAEARPGVSGILSSDRA